MNYKEILEKQISELEEYQKSIKNRDGFGQVVCEIARTIVTLVEHASSEEEKHLKDTSNMVIK